MVVLISTPLCLSSAVLNKRLKVQKQIICKHGRPGEEVACKGVDVKREQKYGEG